MQASCHWTLVGATMIGPMSMQHIPLQTRQKYTPGMLPLMLEFVAPGIATPFLDH
jgi:hypothetical protein